MSSSSRKMLQAASGVGGGDFYPYTIDNSVRIQGTSSKYLSRSTALASSPTDAQKLSFSCWMKVDKIHQSGLGIFFNTMSSGYPTFAIYDYSNYSPHGEGSWEFQDYRPSPEPRYLMRADTISQQRDFSAWYHLYVVVDTTLSTGSDRYKLYLNGVPIPYTTTDQPAETPQNTDWHLFTTTNSAWGMYISPALANNSTYGHDFYLAEAHAVDGTAYDISKFGEFKNGVWIPVEPSGISYGNGGFYLDFADSSDLGKDVSGNGNHYTSTGLTSSDQMIDTPTNNFATLPIGSARTGYVPTVSEGNLKYVTQNSTGTLCGTGIPRSGVWYVEWQSPNCYPGNGYRGYFGLTTVTNGDKLSSSSSYWLTQSAGKTYVGSDYINYGTGVGTGTNSLGPGDIGSLTIDMDNLQITFRLNNSVVASGVAIQDVPHTFCLLGDGTSSRPENTIFNINFGQNGDFNGYETAQGNTDENGIGDFYYAPPSGALALCTANLPEPTIGPNSDTLSDENFNTVLYVGNGTAIGSGGKSVTGVGFQPNMVWTKNRDAAQSWAWMDTQIGTGKYWTHDYTSTGVITNSESLASMDSDGFTVGSLANANVNGQAYVAYCFKKVAGVFDTVGYSGTGSVQNISHNLGAVPKVIIVKRVINANTAISYIDAGQVSDPQTDYIELFTTGTPVDNNTIWNDTAPTSTQFTVGTSSGVNLSSDTYVAYLFAEVEGFSSIGSYTGNGSADGSFIYTGFRPAFVLIKQTDGTPGWLLHDDKREPDNVNSLELAPNLSGGDVTATDRMDFLSNGFKMRSTNTAGNASGGTYIYMAFAENPFKYSNAR